jgi:hypothetical protein
MNRPQGATAVAYGRELEHMVEDLFKRQGFTLIDDKSLKRQFTSGVLVFGSPELGSRWIMRNVKKYRSLYETVFFADFVAYDETHLPNGLVLEVKNQSTAGSVDEKYVYTVLSLKALYQRYNRLEAWLVFSGPGARPCAVTWIKGQQNKHFKVFNESEIRKHLLSIPQADFW